MSAYFAGALGRKSLLVSLPVHCCRSERAEHHEASDSEHHAAVADDVCHGKDLAGYRTRHRDERDEAEVVARRENGSANAERDGPGLRSREAGAPAHVAPIACPVAGSVGRGDRERVMDVAVLGDAECDWVDWSDEQKLRLKDAMVDTFREKYLDRKALVVEVADTLDTSQYSTQHASGLRIRGGHRHMLRPVDVALPPGFEQAVGLITLEALAAFGCMNPDRRYLLSVYGNVFDVSSRPDKYGPDGPYSGLTGKDITWGLFMGNDGEDCCNRCYDLFKATSLGKENLERRLMGLCSWIAWYETEYGTPVGTLDEYFMESELPGPPLEELEDCSIM